MSQATHTHITRRSILAGLGTSIPAAAVAAAPAYADRHPDAELLALGRQWEAADAACAAHLEVIDAAEDRADEMMPDAPEELFQRNSDFRHGFVDAFTRHDGRRWYIGQIDRLRTEPRMKQDWTRATAVLVDGKEAYQCAYVPDPVAQARADEIVAAFDRWKADIKRAEDASGLTAAKAEGKRLDRINMDLRRAIALMPARTMEGLAVKARIYAWFLGGADEVESEFTRHIDTNGPTDETIMLAIVRDLLAQQWAA